MLLYADALHIVVLSSKLIEISGTNTSEYWWKHYATCHIILSSHFNKNNIFFVVFGKLRNIYFGKKLFSNGFILSKKNNDIFKPMTYIFKFLHSFICGWSSREEVNGFQKVKKKRKRKIDVIAMLFLFFLLSVLIKYTVYIAGRYGWKQSGMYAIEICFYVLCYWCMSCYYIW